MRRFGSQRYEPCGHLAAAGVVHTDEQHLRLLLHDQPVRLAESLQALPGEAVRENGHEDVDRGAPEEVDRVGDVPRDRLAAEGAGELVLQGVGGLLHVLPCDRIEDLETVCRRTHRHFPYRRLSISIIARTSIAVNI